MKSIGGIWYVSFYELVSQCHISGATIKSGYERGCPQWESIKHPGPKSAKPIRWIRYDTMDFHYQSIVRRVLCGGLEPWETATIQKKEGLNERSVVELVELAVKDGFRRYLGLYPAEDTSRAADRTQKCLARAAAVVEVIGNYITDRDIDARSYLPYKEVIAWFEQDGNYDYYFPKGCQYLPSNAIRLKEKVVQRFGKPGTEPQAITNVIKLPREGNKSRDKFASDAELMAWIAISRSQGTNDPNAYIIRKVSEVCQIVGREVPSRSWFSQVLASNKMRFMTAEGRFGAGSRHASRFNPYISMARAMYAGDCWMIDATRVNFIEHRTTKSGQNFDFLTVIAVRDAYSGHIVGVHFDTKEDRWGYTNALKMAVKSTGYLPHTLVYDRFPGHMTDEMQSVLDSFERKGVQLICTHKATGKALLERWFDTLQTVFFSKSRYYYGQGIQSKRTYAHRSADYLNRIRKEAHSSGWNFDKAWQEAWQRIEEYVSTPVSYYSRQHKGLNMSPLQLHEQSEKPNAISVELWDQASLFWNTKLLQINRTRLEMEVHGTKYRFQIYDKDILYRYDRVAVRYEESDPSKIMLFAVGVDDRVSDLFITSLEQTSDLITYGPEAETGHVMARQAKLDGLQDRIREDLEQTTNGAVWSPEYLLNMGGKVSKDEFESAQTGIIYEQMGVVVATNAQRPATEKRKKTTPAKPVPKRGVESDFDDSQWINRQFYNQ